VTFGLDTVEEAPTRAAHAAIAGQRALDRARDEGARLPIVHMTLHFAELLVGQGAGAPQIDDDGKRAALGVLDALAASAPTETIVVSEAAAPSLERRFELSEVGAVGGQRSFGLGRRRAGRFASRWRMATFVGRQRELDLLWSRFEDTCRERGQVIGIGGEAGIGKSRLIFEFKQRLAGESVEHLAGYCQPYGSAVPYLPVLDLVRAAAGIADTDLPEIVRGKVEALVRAVGLEAAGAVPTVLGLLGIKEDAEAAVLEPDAVKARIVERLRTIVLKLGRLRPLVVVVEDLHWIDRASEEYFTALVEHLARSRILLVFTYRSGYQPPWIAKSYAAHVSLSPLVPEDSIRVLRSTLPSSSMSDAMIDLIVARSEGNPFFLEELGRAVHEQAEAGGAAAVPETIRGVLLGCMDRLAPDDKRLLQVAAVVGNDGRFALVRAVADVGEEARRGAFARLTGAEFLYATGTSDDGEYSFRHALTHDVAYESLPAPDRRAFHAKVVAVLESGGAEGDAASVEWLAHHAYQGELWERAVTYCREAGVRAAGRSAHREAVANFERALAALARVGIGPATADAAIDLRFHLRNSFQPLGDFGPILDHLREAEVLATAVGDERRLARVTAYMTDYFRLMGRHNLALESGRLALGIAARLGDLTLKLATHTYVGQVHLARGDYREAAALFTRNVEAIGPDLLRERFGFPQLLSVHSRTCLAWSLAELGEFAAALRWAEEGVGIAESVDHPLTIATATAGLGVLLLARGQGEAAARVLERGLEQIRAWNMRLWLPRVASTLGLVYVRSGRVAEGLALLEDAAQEAEAMKLGIGRALLRAYRAEGLLRGGRPAEAEAIAQEALELAREHSERGHEAWTLRLCGEIQLASAASEPAVAATYWRQALDIAEPRGMRPLMAHCLRGLGEAARREGNESEARQHLVAARALFTALGMDADRARVDAALRAVA